VSPAARLITARQALGLTQAQLAERLGMRQGSYAQFEVCRKPVPPGVLARVAEFSGVDPAEWGLTRIEAWAYATPENSDKK
jgi:transcriptional regulator with XRE-family HTH domain